MGAAFACQIGQENNRDRAAQPVNSALQKGLLRRQLPPREALVEDILEECPKEDGPQNRHTQLVSCEGGRRQVPCPDPGSGDKNPRAQKDQQAGKSVSRGIHRGAWRFNGKFPLTIRGKSASNLTGIRF